MYGIFLESSYYRSQNINVNKCDLLIVLHHSYIPFWKCGYFFLKFKKMKPNLSIFIKLFTRSFVRFKARGLVSNKKIDFLRGKLLVIVYTG